MPRKTDGEKIDDLEKLVATLTERLDNIRREMIDRERLAVVEERLNEFKRTIEEASRRRWSLLPPIIGGIIGAVLTFVAQLALTYLRK
jgi:hypothetical protein